MASAFHIKTHFFSLTILFCNYFVSFLTDILKFSSFFQAKKYWREHPCSIDAFHSPICIFIDFSNYV